MKKQTWILILLLIIAILFVVIKQVDFNKKLISKPEQIQDRTHDIYQETKISPTIVLNQNKVKLLIDYGNGNKSTFDVVASNAYEALSIVAEKQGLIVEVKQYKFGILVTKVGDISNDQSSSWMYSVNGKPGNIAADRYLVNTADEILWKFEKFK